MTVSIFLQTDLDDPNVDRKIKGQKNDEQVGHAGSVDAPELVLLSAFIFSMSLNSPDFSDVGQAVPDGKELRRTKGNAPKANRNDLRLMRTDVSVAVRLSYWPSPILAEEGQLWRGNTGNYA
jgi:hypothetical protein